MSGFVNSKYVKTRKDHRCGFCGGLIQKHTKNIEFLSGINYDGEWFNCYLDEFCSKYLSHYSSEYRDDGFDSSSFSEIEHSFYLEFHPCKCDERYRIVDNDTINKKIILTCVDCDNEIKLPYNYILKILKIIK